RPEAAREAAMVAAQCRALGVPHDTLRWTGWDHSGNLQNEARKARYRLLADWARGQGIGAVCIGHTADDLAETFVMRLGRRAGVDGLSAMPA
ncbi:MAG TPA: tRNA lysidine(34) synthetase TilS, partial [Sulfitobacter sp.]|nr:tRNA lysidine(34) synthetase TilS [Sulfitobacter sp.]